MSSCPHRRFRRCILLLGVILLLVTPGASSLQASAGGTVTLQGSAPPGSTVYLSVTGPNLAHAGARLDDVIVPVVDGDPSSFSMATTDMGGQWTYHWDTGAAGALSPGTYQVWISTAPHDVVHLEEGTYASIPVVLTPPGIAIDTTAPTVLPTPTPAVTGTPGMAIPSTAPPVVAATPSTVLSYPGACMAALAVAACLRLCHR